MRRRPFDDLFRAAVEPAARPVADEARSDRFSQAVLCRLGIAPGPPPVLAAEDQADVDRYLPAFRKLVQGELGSTPPEHDE